MNLSLYSFSKLNIQLLMLQSSLGLTATCVKGYDSYYTL